MRHDTFGNCSLLASFALLASLVTSSMTAVHAARSYTLIPTPPQHEKADDWKSKLTSEERSAISKPEGANDRVKTYLRLADSRLKSTRSYLDRDDYTGADEQLMGYAALIADVGQFTKDSVPKRDKAHKTLEVTLREQLRSLEGIRRDISASYSENAEKALKLVNQVRRQALGLLLGEGFLKDTEKQ